MERREFVNIFKDIFSLTGRKIEIGFITENGSYEIEGHIASIKAISDIRETRRLEIELYFKDPDLYPGIRHLEYYPDGDGRPNWNTGIASGWRWYIVTDTGSHQIDAPTIADA